MVRERSGNMHLRKVGANSWLVRTGWGDRKRKWGQKRENTNTENSNEQSKTKMHVGKTQEEMKYKIKEKERLKRRWRGEEKWRDKRIKKERKKRERKVLLFNDKNYEIHFHFFFLQILYMGIAMFAPSAAMYKSKIRACCCNSTFNATDEKRGICFISV